MPSRSPSSAAPAPRNGPRRNPLGYLPALDGLRALAVAAVVAYHLGYSAVPGGYIGVEVFFVLSGWLVCALLAAEHRSHGGIDLRAFWLRRARRLLPAVTLVVATTLVVGLQAGYGHFASLRGDALAALGYVLNWRLIVDQKSYFVAAAAGPSPLQHLWSLSIEEQFYLALPLLLGLTLAGRSTARRAALLALGAAVVATAWRLAVDAPGTDPSRLYYGTDTRAAALLLGAALALVWVPSRLRPVPGRWAGPVLDAVAVAALAVIGWYTFQVGEREPDAFGWSLTVVQIASLTLIAVLVHPVRGLVARALGLRPLRWIGQRSYGIYLWHWPLIVLLAKAPGEQPETPARTAGLVVATLVVAALSFRLVEQPLRRHGVADSISLARRWTAGRIAGRPVLTGTVTALAIVGYVGGVLLARDIVAADDRPTENPPPALTSAPAADPAADLATPPPNRRPCPTPPAPGSESAHPGTPQPLVAGDAPSPGTPAAEPGAEPLAPDPPTGHTNAPDAPAAVSAVGGTAQADKPGAAESTGGDAGSDERGCGSRGGPVDGAGGAGTGGALAVPPAAAVAPSALAPADPAAAAPAPAPALPWTTAIGDSVMQGAVPALQARFGPALVLEATVGFQMVDAPGLVRRLADEGRLGDVVVVHLGANGPFPDGTLDEVVDIVGRRPVLLVGVKVPRRWEAEVNDQITAAADRYPNVEVVDWRTVAETEPGVLWRDGHHLTPAGAERYADLLASYAAAAN